MNSNTEKMLARLLDLLKPGQDVSTLVVHRSASGTKRVVRLFCGSIEQLTLDGGEIVLIPGIEEITGMVASILGLKIDKYNYGIIVNGAGIDAGSDLVQRLSETLYPEAPSPSLVLCHWRL